MVLTEAALTCWGFLSTAALTAAGVLAGVGLNHGVAR
jgi:hypothetical protein